MNSTAKTLLRKLLFPLLWIGVWYAVALCRFVDFFSREKELGENVKLAALLNYRRARREVSRLGKVDTADAVAVSEIIKA